MKLILRSPIRTVAFSLPSDETVSGLKTLVQRVFRLQPSLQRLVCVKLGVRVLMVDEWQLGYYGLRDGGMVWLETLALTEETEGRRRSKAVTGPLPAFDPPSRPPLSQSEKLLLTCQQARLDDFRRIISESGSEARLLLETDHDLAWNCIHFICFFGLYDFLRCISTISVNVNKETKDGWTPLMLAVYQNHLECVQLLLTFPDLNPNHTTSKGSALHIAVQRGSPQLCALLAGAGVNPELVDSKGRKPIDLHCKAEIRPYLIGRWLSDERDYAGVVQFTVTVLKVKAFLVLRAKDRLLSRYENKADYESGKRAVSVTEVDSVVEVHSCKGMFGYKYGVTVVTLNGKTHFYVKTEEEAENWLRHLKALISHTHSRTHLIAPIRDSIIISTPINYRATVALESLRLPESDTYHPTPYITFSDLQILEELGSGAFGRVYKVRLKSKPQFLFALKLLRKTSIKRSGQLIYVLQELQLLQSLSHPFIVKLYHTLQTPKSLGFLLELCPNDDLASLIASKEKLREEVTVFYAAEIVLALEYIHSRNVLYRDLKPENILLDKEGHVRMTDFGIARPVESPGEVTKTFCGSPAYLAPEAVARAGTSQAADVYGLGVVIYEMLTGTPPFFSYNPSELMEQILHRPIEYPEDLSLEASDLLRQLLARRPDQRPTASMLRSHPFFRSIDWDLLFHRAISPPDLGLKGSAEDSRETVYPLGTVDKDYSQTPSMEDCWVDFA